MSTGKKEQLRREEGLHAELTTLRTEVLELREAVRRGMVEAARLEAQRDEARTRAEAHRARVGELGRLVRELRAVAEEADDGQLAWEVVDDESPDGRWRVTRWG